MPKLVPSRFASFIFDSPEEEKAAQSFSELNKMYLCNLRCELQELKLKLKINPDKPLQDLQNEASLTGQINLLDQLLGVKENG